MSILEFISKKIRALVSHEVKSCFCDYDIRIRRLLSSQNENLLNFKLPSEFDYDNKELTNAKIIGIFDQDFNPVHHLTAPG